MPGLELNLGMLGLAPGVGWGSRLKTYYDNPLLTSITPTKGSGGTFTRNSVQYNYAASASVSANNPMFEAAGYLSEPASTNYFLNSASPVTQNITVTTANSGRWTVTVWGAGTVTTSAGTATATGYGVAQAGTPNTITVTVAGTVTFTVAGADATTKVNVENAAYGSSFISTAGATVTRAQTALSYPIAGNCPSGTPYCVLTTTNKTKNRTDTTYYDLRGYTTNFFLGSGADGNNPEQANFKDVAIYSKPKLSVAANDIGVPNRPGFGVGIYPGTLPSGFTAMDGTTNPLSDNYGNYTFRDGSVMVWIPKFYYKEGTGSNGLAVNETDIRPASYFANTAAANAAGYALHRAFIDGGVEQNGFFIDKYKASKNALGTGFIASSIKNGKPLSTASTHNPIGDLTAVAGVNTYYATLDAAKARDGVNGAKNANSQFFTSTRFQTAALALLTKAIASYAANNSQCAWYSSAAPFPKGCNNNTLGDINDATVSYVSDGYQNSALTGSGTPFAKTTHNGQACGVADLNGLMYEVNPGLTCIASAKTITGATQANPCVITIAGHGYTTGQMVQIQSAGGMTQINDKIYTLTVIDANTFSLNGVNATGYTAYTSGGSATTGTFYTLKTSVAMKNVTSGNTLATDHWGATAAAAQFDAITMPFATGTANNGFVQSFGNGSTQVLSEATTGDPWKLAGLGFPKTGGSVSATGTALFGNDYFYQYMVNELVPLSYLAWYNTANAGVWGVFLGYARSLSNSAVGFRLACYPY